MTNGQMLTAGLLCCTLAMTVQMFPAAAYAVGADLGAAWRLFGFGIFLIAVAALMTAASGRCGCPK